MFNVTIHPDQSVTVTDGSGRECATFTSHHHPAYAFFVQGVEAQHVEINLPSIATRAAKYRPEHDERGWKPK